MAPELSVLLLCNAAVGLFAVFGLVFFRLTQRTFAGFDLWIASALSIVLGHGMIGLRTLGLPAAASTLISNGLFAVASVARLDGTRRFVSGRPLPRLAYAAVPAVLAYLLACLSAFDSPPLRNIAIMLVAATAATLIGIFFVRSAPGNCRPVHVFAAVTYFVFAAEQVGRAAIWLTLPGVPLTAAHPIHLVHFLLMSVFETAWALVFVMITTMRIEGELASSRAELDATVSELERAADEVRTLSGLLPICVHCKRIRDDSGYWQQVESYVQARSDAQFTHGICPDCARILYGDLTDPAGAT